MRCSKCNNEISEGKKFCGKCGTPVDTADVIRKISLKCSQCNGVLTVDSNRTVLSCPYCGNQSLIIENDAVTIERIRNATQKEVEMEKIRSRKQVEMEKISQDAQFRQKALEKEERDEEKALVRKFRKGVLSKFLLVAFFLAALFTFLYVGNHLILATLLSGLQTLCFAAAWCMGMNIIKEKGRPIHVVLSIVGILLFFPIVFAFGNGQRNKDISDIKWSAIFLGDKLPEPPSTKMEIHWNSDDSLWLTIYGISESEYYDYVLECKEMGYTVEADNTFGYDAYNDEGYHLRLDYDNYGSHDEEMDINLDPPAATEEMNWSEHKIADIIPAPKSAKGVFDYENDENAQVVISGISVDDFKDYCEECKEKGFTIEAESNSDSYSAFDSEGNKLDISINAGNKELTIYVEYARDYKTITWPEKGIAVLMPVPDSLSVCVASDTNNHYSIYVENMTMEDCENYIKKCKDVGYTVDAWDFGDGYYSADYDKDEEIHISVSYEGFNVVYIKIEGGWGKDYSSYTGDWTDILK